MINYTSCPIIPPNVKAIGRTTSQELHSQSEAGRRGQTEKLYAPILPIVCRALKKKKKKLPTNIQELCTGRTKNLQGPFLLDFRYWKIYITLSPSGKKNTLSWHSR